MLHVTDTSLKCSQLNATNTSTLIDNQKKEKNYKFIN